MQSPMVCAGVAGIILFPGKDSISSNARASHRRDRFPRSNPLTELPKLDHGATWSWTRHLEREESGKGSFHYPSIIQGADGTLHASYSYFVPTPEGERKSIKVATFSKAWILQGDE